MRLQLSHFSLGQLVADAKSMWAGRLYLDNRQVPSALSRSEYASAFHHKLVHGFTLLYPPADRFEPHNASYTILGPHGLDEQAQRVHEQHPAAVGAGACTPSRRPRRQAISHFVQADRVVDHVLGVQGGLAAPSPDPRRSHGGTRARQDLNPRPRA